MFNIGFDSNVVDMTARMKKLPLMSGSLAYLASVGTMLAEKKGADLRVEYEDGSVFDGRLLLIAVANGCFCGGGVKGIPKAVTDDGMFDVSLVRDVPRHMFAALFPKYMNGTHLSDPRLDDVIRYTHETSLRISPNRKLMKLCVDGEITKAGPVRFAIAPNESAKSGAPYMALSFWPDEASLREDLAKNEDLTETETLYQLGMVMPGFRGTRFGMQMVYYMAELREDLWMLINEIEKGA
jgi:hypothetical protein